MFFKGLLELNFQNVLEDWQTSDAEIEGEIITLNIVSEANAWLSVIPAPSSDSAGNFSTGGQFHLAFRDVAALETPKKIRISQKQLQVL